MQNCTCTKHKNFKYSMPYILPYDICKQCAIKHLSYALIKYNKNEIARCIGQLYLAYLHLNRGYRIEATKVFELIQNIFNNSCTNAQLTELIEYLNTSTNEIESKHIKL